jgi:hypothetical protein
MDKSKTPRHKSRWHDPKWVGGVLDSSISQGPFSVAPCQTLVSRFATFFIAVLDPAPAPLVVLLSAEASALGLWQVERRPRYDAQSGGARQVDTREKLYGCPFVLKSGSYGRRGNQPVGRRVSATCLSLL